MFGWTIALAVLQGCTREVKPAVTAGVDACAACNMAIDRTNQACGYVLDGRFVPFDSPVCLLRSYEALRKTGGKLPEAVYFADYQTRAFHRADSTAFLLTDYVPTVMNARVICFGNLKDARAFMQHDDEAIEDWRGYQLARGAPDRRVSIRLDPQGMHPETIEVKKGDLVHLSLRGVDLKDDLVLAIRGYDEAGEIRVPASGGPVARRFWALRPGAGFPVVDVSSNHPVGMVRVVGAHTADEEAR